MDALICSGVASFLDMSGSQDLVLDFGGADRMVHGKLIGL
jgi:hypothetical protein